MKTFQKVRGKARPSSTTSCSYFTSVEEESENEKEIWVCGKCNVECEVECNIRKLIFGNGLQYSETNLAFHKNFPLWLRLFQSN